MKWTTYNDGRCFFLDIWGYSGDRSKPNLIRAEFYKELSNGGENWVGVIKFCMEDGMDSLAIQEINPGNKNKLIMARILEQKLKNLFDFFDVRLTEKFKNVFDSPITFAYKNKPDKDKNSIDEDKNKELENILSKIEKSVKEIRGHIYEIRGHIHRDD